MNSTLTRSYVPFCTNCDTAKFLSYEDFIPSHVLPSGLVKSVSVNYTCMQCENFSGHDVPTGWEPPGWFWYA